MSHSRGASNSRKNDSTPSVLVYIEFNYSKEQREREREVNFKLKIRIGIPEFSGPLSRVSETERERGKERGCMCERE